ncbi:transcriptional regulator domain-containing protein [Sphingopyxis sp.]|uniref:transcriptional regulator domain-containing protein n=1 Tax=Sphingopyxis sp. TaxID=1908224 RepID=UPI003D6D5B4F
MPHAVDWRSPDFLKIFELYDRADFAQEFLRRNPRYRAAYQRAAAPRRPGAALGRLARHWGLVFRR